MLLLPVISQPGANLAQLDGAGARAKERVRQGVKKEREKRDVGARMWEGLQATMPNFLWTSAAVGCATDIIFNEIITYTEFLFQKKVLGLEV